MDLRPVLRPAAAGVILFLTLGAAPQRDSATLVALGKIERGQWQLKEAGGPAQKPLAETAVKESGGSIVAA